MIERIKTMKNRIVARKTAILLTALTVTTTAAVLGRLAIRQHNEFLVAKDLYQEFYTSTEW